MYSRCLTGKQLKAARNKAQRAGRAGAYSGFVAGQKALGLATAHIPQAHSAVTGACAHIVAIGMPSDDIHVCVVPCMHG